MVKGTIRERVRLSEAAIKFMTETVKNFIELVDKKEAAYYTDVFPMPREMMIALRDELRETARLEAEHDALLENLQPIKFATSHGKSAGTWKGGTF